MKISPQLLWLLSGRCLFHVQAVEKNLNKDILPQPPVRRCHASVAIGSKCQFGGIHQVRANITQKESPWCEFQSSVWSALHVLCFEGCCLTLVKQQSWSGPLGRMVSEKICNSCGVFSHSKGVGAELFSGHYGSLGRIGLPEGSTKRQGSAKRSCGGLPTILDICLPHGCCFKRVLWSVPPAVPYIYLPVSSWGQSCVKCWHVSPILYESAESDPSCRCCWGILWVYSLLSCPSFFRGVYIFTTSISSYIYTEYQNIYMYIHAHFTLPYLST